MQLARPAFGVHPKFFGKGPVRDVPDAAATPVRWADDLKLFAATFAAGFVFVSILIG